MKPISAIIIDDEPDAINLLEDLLKDFDEIKITATADNVNTAFEVIKDQTPDLVFLDIQMPEQNGFELIKKLKTENLNHAIIFVTAYDQYAIQAVKHAAFDYLLKPVDRDELKEAIGRFRKVKQDDLRERLNCLLDKLERPQKIRFNVRTGYILIDPEEIVYCQADGNYTDIFLTTREKEIVTYNLSNVWKMFPEKNFFRISRFNIINLKFLTRVDRKSKTCELTAVGHTYRLPLPKKQMKELKKTINP